MMLVIGCGRSSNISVADLLNSEGNNQYWSCNFDYPITSTVGVENVNRWDEHEWHRVWTNYTFISRAYYIYTRDEGIVDERIERAVDVTNRYSTGNKLNFALALVSIDIELTNLSRSLEVGEWSQTDEKIESFAELLFQHMSQNGYGAEQSYACTKIDFLLGL